MFIFFFLNSLLILELLKSLKMQLGEGTNFSRPKTVFHASNINLFHRSNISSVQHSIHDRKICLDGEVVHLVSRTLSWQTQDHSDYILSKQIQLQSAFKFGMKLRTLEFELNNTTSVLVVMNLSQASALRFALQLFLKRAWFCSQICVYIDFVTLFSYLKLSRIMTFLNPE